MVTANELIIMVNLLISAMSIWAVMVVNAKFLKPALLNQKRFVLYRLRDKLTLLAMRGVVSQESEEYITLLRLINRTIASTKNFRITKFIKIQAEIVTNKKIQDHLDSILRKIENKKMPLAYQKLVSEFFAVSLQLYERRIWFVRKALSPLLMVVKTVRFFRRAHAFLKAQSERIESTENAWVNNRDRFSVPV